MKTQNQIYTTLAATLLLLLFAGQASAQTTTPPMRASLASSLPANDPYCRDPANTDKLIVNTTTIPNDLTPCEPVSLPVGKNATGAGSDFPAGVVDWVLVEVRDGTGPAAANVVARKPALLLQNGRVVDAVEYIALNASAPTENNTERDACLNSNVVDNTACPQVSFGNAAFGGGQPTIANSAFLVVRHRNHLDIQADQPAALNNNQGYYDFSSTSTRLANGTVTTRVINGSGGVVVGGTSGIKPRTISAGNVLAMRQGDADGNGVVALSDGYNDVVNSGIIGFVGYSILDINMNGSVALSDGYDDVVRSGNIGAVVSNVFRFPPTR